MKRAILILGMVGLLAALMALAYRPIGRWLAQRQVDRVVVKGPATEALFAKDPLAKQDAAAEAFLQAACGGDPELALAFVRAGYPVEVRNQKDLTPLHCAAALGNLELAEALLAAGADVAARTREHEVAAIHYAAWYRQWDMVRFLVGKGASIDQPSRIGPPILLTAHDGKIWRYGRLSPEVKQAKRPVATLAQGVKELQSLGAALDVAGAEGMTLLHWAAFYQDVPLMQLLVEKAGLAVDVKNERGQTPLQFALTNTAWEGANGPDSHVATVRWLVARGANVNTRDEEGASLAAVAVRNPQLLALLPDLDLNVADNQGHSIWSALGIGAVPFARTQASIGVPRMTNGGSGIGPLHVCIKDALQDCTEYFLQRGVSPNQVDHEGLTALHEALRATGGMGDVARNRPLIVKALLDAGADVNARTAKGQTPLMLAVGQPAEVVRMLIERRADVNAMSMESGQLLSVLDRFQKRGNAAGIDLLVKAGARTAAEKWDYPEKVGGPGARR